METSPEYVLRWDEGKIYFRPQDGAVAATVVCRPSKFLDIAKAVEVKRGWADLTEIGFSLKHISQMLITSPFRLVCRDDEYSLIPKLHETIADDGKQPRETFNV